MTTTKAGFQIFRSSERIPKEWEGKIISSEKVYGTVKMGANEMQTLANIFADAEKQAKKSELSAIGAMGLQITTDHGSRTKSYSAIPVKLKVN